MNSKNKAIDNKKKVAKKMIWQNQEVKIVRKMRPNLQNKEMVEIEASPNQKYVVPLNEISHD